MTVPDKIMNKPLILVVDDSPVNIDLLLDILKTDYRFGVAKNGLKAFEYLKKTRPDLILLDIMMPEMDGFEACRRIKSDPALKDIEVIFITALTDARYIARGFDTGAVDYITKPLKAAEVKARVRTHITLKKMKDALSRQNLILEERIEQKTAQLREMFFATVNAMAMMAESRDPYTAGHQHRVARYAAVIADRMGLAPERIESIRIAGLLHDIGKIRISVALLNRPGQLLQAEWELIKMHPAVGYAILKDIPFPWPIAEIVHQHHERINGTGYPRGLSGEEILQEAKILAVADVIEAVISHRPYRPARKIGVVLKILKDNRGILFDEAVVDACLESTDFLEENKDTEIDDLMPMAADSRIGWFSGSHNP